MMMDMWKIKDFVETMMVLIVDDDGHVEDGVVCGHVLKVGNSSQIFQVNHIVGPVTFAGKSQHNLVSFPTWLVLVKQTIS